MQLMKNIEVQGGRSLYMSTQKPINLPRAERVIGKIPDPKNFMYLQDQVDFIYHDIRQHAETGDLKLVIIDPITGLLSDAFLEPTRTTLINRADFLARQATVLKHLSYKYDFVLICINTVVADFKSDSVHPALGQAWSNCLNERYIITKHQHFREIRAAFSPNIPSDKSYAFQITDYGIEPFLE